MAVRYSARSQRLLTSILRIVLARFLQRPQLLARL